MTKIRTRKDGGCSECNSPDELVGKGRCCHISDESNQVMELSRIQRGMYEVKVCESTLKIEAQEKTIVDFFNSLPKIDEEKRSKIIDYLNEE